MIGVVFNNILMVPQAWKVNMGFSTTPDEKPSFIRPNFSAILTEMEKLGEGLCVRIESKKF